MQTFELFHDAVTYRLIRLIILPIIFDFYISRINNTQHNTNAHDDSACQQAWPRYRPNCLKCRSRKWPHAAENSWQLWPILHCQRAESHELFWVADGAIIYNAHVVINATGWLSWHTRMKRVLLGQVSSHRRIPLTSKNDTTTVSLISQLYHR